MKWISHILISGAVCAVFNPMALPAAIAGATAPDWSEKVINKTYRQNKVKHRGVTHYLLVWALIAAVAWAGLDYKNYLFWFAIGGVTHWFCDALTVQGVPLGWMSDRRMTLFGGKVITGSAAEYTIAALFVIAAVFVVHSRSHESGFIPFFYNWEKHYENGLIDGHEWRTNRYDFI
jgi:inner membrane protein